MHRMIRVYKRICQNSQTTLQSIAVMKAHYVSFHVSYLNIYYKYSQECAINKIKQIRKIILL